MRKFLLNSTGMGITAPLDASYFKGCGLRQGLEREFILLEMLMKVYPKITVALCANSHPGSYTGQDAFNNMLPVIRRDHDLLDLPGHFPISEGGAQQQFNGKRLQRWKRSYTGGRNGRSGQKICAKKIDAYRMSALAGVA